ELLDELGQLDPVDPAGNQARLVDDPRAEVGDERRIGGRRRSAHATSSWTSVSTRLARRERRGQRPPPRSAAHPGAAGSTPATGSLTAPPSARGESSPPEGTGLATNAGGAAGPGRAITRT